MFGDFHSIIHSATKHPRPPASKHTRGGFCPSTSPAPPQKNKKTIYIYISIYPAVSPYKATTLPHFMYTHTSGRAFPALGPLTPPKLQYTGAYILVHRPGIRNRIHRYIYIWAQDSSMLVYTSAFLCIGGAGTLVCSVAQGGLSTRFVRTSRA